MYHLLCRTKESCHLLTLLQGSGVLLREVLLTSVKAASNSSADADAETCLIDVGVHKLTRQQALAVLMRRVDWLQSKQSGVMQYIQIVFDYVVA